MMEPMKRKLLAVALFAASMPAHAAMKQQEKESLMAALAGEYVVVVKEFISEKTHVGAFSLSGEGRNYRAERIMGGRKIIGRAEITDATPDRIPLLCIDYMRGNRQCYLWKFDMENYPVLMNAVIPNAPGTGNYEALFFRKN